MTFPEQAERGAAGRISLAALTLRLSQELARAAEDCLRFQSLTSRLLEKAHHPDLVSEFHMLQDLDRLHQVLNDLSVLTARLSSSAEDRFLAGPDFAESLTLLSLRHRLFPASPGPGPAADEADITWF